MSNTQEKLKEIGLYAERTYNKPTVGIFKLDTNEKVMELSGEELLKNDTPEKTWELIQSKLNG